jgi:lipopolysaccharide export system permease protein
VRIIDRYIVHSFFTTFAVTVLVVTFVMCIGLLFRVTDLLARGAPFGLIVRVLAWGVPVALSFATPVSLLTASLLVFGKMSADNEIVAMRSGGISVWQIASKPLLVAGLLAVVCLYVNCELAPVSRYRQRLAVRQLGMEAPLDLLEEGRFIREFPAFTIYVGRKENNRIFDILIYESKGSIRREIRAQSGVVGVSRDGHELVVTLRDVRIDPFSDDRPGPGFCKKWPLRIPFDFRAGRPLTKRDGDYASGELWQRIRQIEVFLPELKDSVRRGIRMEYLVQFNKRIALAASCFTFVLLGVPLGIRTHRRESSIGLAMSLVLLLGFYVFLLVADSLSKRPEAYPYLFVWFPVAFSIVLGMWLVRRSA